VNKITYHFVSQTHWDREWVLSFEEYRVMLVDFWNDLFNIFENDPDFKHFMTDGQMQMVMDYLEVKPQNFERIKELVQSGRLSIGPWYIQIDQFIPSGESHIRNLLIGVEMAQKFGRAMPIGYIPDQFGHIAQMPQILRGFDIETAVIYRGFGGEPGQESSEYVWESPDGSKVLMFHLPKDGYSFGYFAMDDEDTIFKRFERLRSEIDARARASHRLILNGGDHHWPDIKLTKALKLLKTKYSDFEFLHSTLENFADCVRSEVDLEKLPKHFGETRFGLRHAFAVIGGTASTRVYIKQRNYLAQIKLERILEPLNSFSFILAKKDRSELIKLAWLYCLQNQDHDTINGTAVDRVYHEALVRYLKIDEITNAFSFQATNDIIPFDSKFFKDDKHIFIFNLSPFELDKVVECEVEFHLQDVVVGLNPDVKPSQSLSRVDGFRIFDSDGGEVEYQVLSRDTKYSLVWGYHEYPHQILVDRFKILVDLKNLPSFGWKRLDIVRDSSIVVYEEKVKYGVDEFGIFYMENDFLKIKVNKNGSIKVIDKEKRIEFDNLNIFEESGDVGDEYNYCFPDEDELYYSTDFTPSIEIIEKGPLRCAVQIRYNIPVPSYTTQSGRSKEKIDMEISSVIYLNYNSKRVDVKTKVNNKAKNHRLRVIFDTGLNTNTSYADSQFCIVKRIHKKYNWEDYPYEKPLNLEVLQRFVCVQDEIKGIAIFTKGLYEYELSIDEPGRLAITLLRGVGQLSESNLKTRPGGDAGWKNETPDAQCIGIYEFEYSIFVYKANEFEDVCKQAELYHSPNFYVKRKQEMKEISDVSLINFEGNGINYSALKVSEDKKGVIFRFYNPFWKDSWFRFKPNFDYASVSIVKLNEEKIALLEPDEDKFFKVDVEPFKIITIKVEL